MVQVEVEARVDLHASDVNAAIYHDNQLYTAGDDGLIKVQVAQDYDVLYVQEILTHFI